LPGTVSVIVLALKGEFDFLGEAARATKDKAIAAEKNTFFMVSVFNMKIDYLREATASPAYAE